MTSNNHERDNASSGSGTSSVSPSPGTGAGTGRGGNPPATGPVAGTSGVKPSETSSRPATPAGESARSKPSGTTERTSTERGTAGTKGKEAGRKSKPGSGSGGDWNVFRTVVIIVGLVIAGFGAYYLIAGTAGLPETEASPVNPTLENQFRFFSAVMIGVGAAFITIAIKFQWANMLWLVCLMIFIGGIGRVLSWAFSGTPNYLLIILMVVELAFPPALLVWHKYIAKTSELRQEFSQRS